MLNNQQKNKILDMLLLLVGLTLFFETIFYHEAIVNVVTKTVMSMGAGGWLSLGIVQFLQTILIPIPASFITIIGIEMYPNNLVTLFNVIMVANVVGVIVAYFIGRKWGKKAVVWCAGSEEEYDKWLKVLKTKKTNFVYLLTVLFPVFPDDLLCVMAGSIKMNFSWFLFCNILGRAIGLVTSIWFLSLIRKSILTIIVLIIAFVVLLILKIIITRKIKNEFNDNRK